MSDVTQISATARPRDLSGILVLVFAIIGAIWFLTREGDRPLNRSAIGHDGLITWLRATGLEARKATGMQVQSDTIGLRLLPIHDTDLSEIFARPATQEEFLKTGTEMDIEVQVMREKLGNLPTLVIAPKWTRAMRYSGYAHATLLIDPAEASDVFHSINTKWPELIRPATALLQIPVAATAGGEHLATLYAPQLFAPELPDKCTSMIGTAAGHLLLECKGVGRSFWAMSDPDILNNHGLTLGDNAALAGDLLAKLAGGKPILLDNTAHIFAIDRIAQQPTRQWSDLMRFFQYPFAMIWIGFLCLAVLALWRSAIRFGPAARPFNDLIGASKSVSIAAKARLMRLSGNDFGLMENHVQNRIQTLAGEIVGAGRSGGAPLKQIAAIVRVRNPALAREFQVATAAALTPPRDATSARLLDLLDEFETQTEKVLHELGRT